MAAEEKSEIGTVPNLGNLVLAILIVIILRAALESFFPPLIDKRSLQTLIDAWPPQPITTLRIFQFFIFLVLLARFYWGAYRFNQEEPPAQRKGATFLNVVGTFGLFCLFYVIAVEVWTIDLFYALILLMHLFDLLWFATVLWKKDSSSALKEPAGCFVVLDLLTILLSVLLIAIFWKGFLTGTHFYAQISLLVMLGLISLFDWFRLRKFYFEPEEWRKELT